jgi:hypothetical protein
MLIAIQQSLLETYEAFAALYVMQSSRAMSRVKTELVPNISETVSASSGVWVKSVAAALTDMLSDVPTRTADGINVGIHLPPHHSSYQHR